MPRARPIYQACDPQQRPDGRWSMDVPGMSGVQAIASTRYEVLRRVLAIQAGSSIAPHERQAVGGA
jgi:hypothetical protein